MHRQNEMAFLFSELKEHEQDEMHKTNILLNILLNLNSANKIKLHTI
jgi:hypothetical protein